MRWLDWMIVKTLPLVPKSVVGRLSKPYIAGTDLEHAVACVKQLNEQGFKATIDVLGEFVTSFEQVEKTVPAYLEVLEAIQDEKLDANISVKPTSFGLLLDDERCRQELTKVLRCVFRYGNFLRIDMEDSKCTTKTINLYEHFRKSYGNHVGVVLQAYMRRSLDDIEAMSENGPAHYRLCKGIYVEPASIAFKKYAEVRQNFLDSLEAMLDNGSFVGIATHDEYLVEKAEEMVKQRGLGPDRYEFQMLLGVREKLRDKIKSNGHQIRIYVPFGRDWYGYSIRRLKENPALAGTFFKAMFVKG